MFVVTVTFTIKPGRMPDFLPLMRRQARASLDREPGCRQFDICTDAAAPDALFLYEIYDDADAFRLHLGTAHFTTFDAAVAGMVAEKQARTWHRIT